ncbi:MAG: hypothetical protein IJB67_01825 [Firmicutes bacterium]|nr:hypothetical protein [Bacillota bacterium]
MLREQAVYHGQATSGERVQSSGPQDSIGSQVAQIVDMSNRLRIEIMNFAALREEIVGNIQALSDPVHSEVLYKRYVEYKSWRRIANEMQYSADHARGALHNAALRSFRQYMCRQWRDKQR